MAFNHISDFGKNISNLGNENAIGINEDTADRRGDTAFSVSCFFPLIQSKGENKPMNEIEQAVNQYAAERRRAYQREYRRTHPEKVKQYRKNAIRAAYRRLMEQEGGNLNG